MNNPVTFLKELEKQGIDYVILRGFLSIEEINNSKDVDIYIPPKFKKKVDIIFKEKGWYSPRTNCSRYPHKQYIQLTKQGLKKIDVVFGLYYGKELYHYNYENEIIKNRKKINGIYVPNEEQAMQTLILHICFDKCELSKDNKNRIKDLKEKYQSLENTFFSKILNDMYSKNININDIKAYRKKIINNEILSKRKFHYRMIKFYISNFIYAAISRTKNKNICILGVDGSGKTTTIEMLQDIFKENIIIQYMGFRNYKSKKLNQLTNKKNVSKLQNILIIMLQWKEFICKYYEYRFTKKIVIFDRYPDESIINFSGIAKTIAFIQYKIFFPKPQNIYYLYCSTTTSLERKNDIPNKEKFYQKKKKFDKIYLNSKKIICIDTDKNNLDEVMEQIIDDWNKKHINFFI